MIEFREIKAKYPAVEWDNNLLKFQDLNFQQIYSFGEFGRFPGADVFRAMLVDGDQPLVMAQGLMRKTIFGGRLLFIRGGPIYQTSKNENSNLKHLRVFLQHLLKANRDRHRFFYLNVIMNGERRVTTEIALREVGMSKPYLERAPHLTYIVPIHRDLDQNMKAFDAKWRNQLRRAESHGPAFTWGNDDSMVKSYAVLHNKMCRIKSIQNFSLTEEALFSMQRHLGERLQFLIGHVAGEDVCACAVVIDDNRAFYYYAAANEEGRAGYFSNAMVWHLIQKLQELNVPELDLVGIDPTRNWGGYHFKKGIGGTPFAYEGEWDYGFPGFVKLFMNIALSWRTRQIFR